MAEGYPDTNQLASKLDQILTILKRIEERQIKTTALVKEIEAEAPPVVGSFASSDLGDKEEKK